MQGQYSVMVQDQSCVKLSNIGTVIVPEIIIDFTLDSLANVFTPDGDGKNDVYYPFASTNASVDEIANYLSSFYIKVYNRWGNLVYEGNSYLSGWNGKNKGGMEMPEGIYFWVSSYQTNCSLSGTPPVEKKGFVHLYK